MKTLNSFAQNIQDAADSAAEGLRDFQQKQVDFAYEQEQYFAGRRGDSLAQRDAAENRAFDLEYRSWFETDPEKRHELEVEAFRLRCQASDYENEAAEKRKRAAEQAASLAYSQLTNNRDRWAFQSNQFAQADAAFDAARNDAERFEAVQKMQESYNAAKELEKALRELAKRDAKPIDPQTAITRGSGEAFKIENRIRNVWQNKMLQTSTRTNWALGRIYERLGTIAHNNTDTETTVEVK